MRDAARGFYIVAAIQAALSFLLGSALLLDAALFSLLAFWLERTFNRIPAFLLVVVSLAAIVVTFSNITPGGTPRQGGTNIGLALIVFAIAVRSAYAAIVFANHEAREGSRTPSA